MTRKRRLVIFNELLIVFLCGFVLTYMYRDHGFSVDRGTAMVLCTGGAFLLANFQEDMLERWLLLRVTERGRRFLYLLEFVADFGIFFLGAVYFFRIYDFMASLRIGIIISLELAVMHFMLRKITGQLRPRIKGGNKCRSTEKTSK